MPVHRYSYTARHQRSDLVDRLTKELREESNQQLREEYDAFDSKNPQIYIDEGRGPEFLHVCVIWPLWDNVPDVQRPAIIMDAFEKAGRKKERDGIAVAMGLTPDKAEVLGINPGGSSSSESAE